MRRVVAQSNSVTQPATAMNDAIGTAVLPSVLPTRTPMVAPAHCCAKPRSEDAVPACRGNGISAAAVDCASRIASPEK
jgi:hypothetical protein